MNGYRRLELPHILASLYAEKSNLIALSIEIVFALTAANLINDIIELLYTGC